MDTPVLVRPANEPGKLSKMAGDAIRRASQGAGIGISPITLRELAWLAILGRLEITGTVEAFVEMVSPWTAIRPITEEVVVLANQLPADYSDDPCDRLMGATALTEDIALMTRDEKIRASNQIRTIW